MELEEVKKRNREISKYLKYLYSDKIDILDCKTKIQNMFNAQQKEIEQLKEDLLISNNSMIGIQMINTKLKEEIRMLKQKL